MEFETERLVIRRWRLEDLNGFYEHASNLCVAEFAGWKPVSREDSAKVLQKIIDKDEARAIICKEDEKIMGIIGVHADPKRTSEHVRMITYSISKEYWGNGFMTEAVKSLVQHTFRHMEIEILSVYHYPFNIGSKRVIEKCGFKFEGILKKASKIFNGNIYDDVCYSLDKADFLENINQ